MKKCNFMSINIQLSDILDDKKFIIPQFQRSVVWKAKRRKDFIYNIRNGEPFGVILIRMNNDRYELIDGLQRITTIRDYINNPFEYLSVEDINLDIVREILVSHLCDMKVSIDEKYMSERIPALASELFNCLRGKLEVWEAIDSIREKFGFKSKEISSLINKVYVDFNEEMDISNLNVLAIDYRGPSENIPTVFYNLNTGGVQLSKYETYAALWSKPLFHINDDLIIKNVKNKYLQLQEDSELDVDFDEEDIIDNGISLFEYCYALSGVIRNKENNFDLLFGENNKSTDPIGFEILSLILGLNVNKAEKIYDILKFAPDYFLADLKKMIEEALKELHKILKPTLKSLNNVSLCSDSTYLIYHILISYIKEYYTIDFKAWSITKNSNTLSIIDLKKYLPIHYVYDCLTDYWRINRQVSNLQRDINSNEKRRKYWSNIKINDWEKGIDEFIESQMSVSKAIPQKNKLFIDFLMKMKLKVQPQYHIRFSNSDDYESGYLDFEHIVPKKVIQNHIRDLTASQQNLFTVSNVGNLCYMTIKDNRSKRDKTIYEYKENRHSYTFDKDYLSFIMYPDKESIDFIHYANTDFREEYVLFVKQRCESMRNEFLELIRKIYF